MITDNISMRQLAFQVKEEKSASARLVRFRFLGIVSTNFGGFGRGKGRLAPAPAPAPTLGAAKFHQDFSPTLKYLGISCLSVSTHSPFLFHNAYMSLKKPETRANSASTQKKWAICHRNLFGRIL